MRSDKMTIMLSIAGSDNSAGAGVQSDIKTCKALKAYCLNCLTLITSQNSKQIFKVFELPLNIITSQFNSIMKDYKTDCIKIGLIGNLNQAKIIKELIKGLKRKIPIVVDPIYKSTTNNIFNDKNDYISIYKIISEIKPVFTPNLIEAKTLLNVDINTKISMEELISNFYKKFNSLVVITDSGDKKDYCVDYFLDEKKNLKKAYSKKVLTNNTHGSGCTFSSSLAIYLARGFKMSIAVKMSKEFTKKCIIKSPNFNLDYGPIGH